MVKLNSNSVAVDEISDVKAEKILVKNEKKNKFLDPNLKNSQKVLKKNSTF